MLYLVATPIGNLEDITLRAIRILKTVDLIAAEDTRHTAKLLQHYQITTPTISYHQHNRRARIGEIISRLQQKKAIALVCDAGMPAISDPGCELVRASIEAGIEIIPIPGANAALTALVASGLKTERFVFEGFLPTKSKLRSDRLESLKRENRTMIFYEAPHRLEKTLVDLESTFGPARQVVLARELTKLHEEFWRGTLGEAISQGSAPRHAHYQDIHQPKGEYTLILEGCSADLAIELSAGEIEGELAKLLSQGMTKTEASRYLAGFTPLSRREIYQLSLKIESCK